MKIGIVCEGVTDFHAMRHYLGAALHQRGVAANFVPLQPNPDNTNRGGWPQVLTWLERNPPSLREPLFGAGLFANSSRFSGLDYLIIQLDTDIIPEAGFRNFLRDNGYEAGNPETVPLKAAEIASILLHFSKDAELSPDLKERHIQAPIAEASEAWCVAADPEFLGDPESLSGQSLIDEFGKSLARFSRQPLQAAYLRINKTSKTRDRYCAGTSGNHLLVRRCSLFDALVEKIVPAA